MRGRTYSAEAMAGKRSRDIGVIGETLTRSALQIAGLAEIERVHTPFKIIRNSRGQIINAVPEQKVSGDFRAVDPTNGKSVLVEAKTRSGDRVIWSDLEDHQVEALNGHVKAGAIALLSVVLEDKAILLEWPVPGFGPGVSLRILGGRLYVSGTKRGSRRSPLCGSVPTSTDTDTNVHLLTSKPTA